MRLKAGHGPITPQTEKSNAILCSVELELGRSGRRKFFDIAVKLPLPSLDTRGRVPASSVQSAHLL